MVQSASIGDGPLGYRGVQTLRTSDRVTAMTAVIALHAAVVGVFAIAQLRAPPPPETTLSVSFITEETAAAPSPPQPQAATPPPDAKLMATAAKTPSPMSAPPIEERVQPQQATPAAPSPPAPAAAPSTAAAPAPVTPPSFSAAYLNNPLPAYPMAARRKRAQGVTRLRVHVSPEGAPDQVQLDRTSGHAELDAAALDVVKKRWRFTPAKQGDRIVAAWVIVPLEFSLDR